MIWKVHIRSIVWDDGKGEHDVSALPTDLEVEIDADDAEDAIDRALEDVSESYGSLIESSTVLTHNPRRRSWH